MSPADAILCFTGSDKRGGNVSANVGLYNGSMLTSGAFMALSGQFDARDTGTTLDMAGHRLSADTVLLGWTDARR